MNCLYANIIVLVVSTEIRVENRINVSIHLSDTFLTGNIMNANKPTVGNVRRNELLNNDFSTLCNLSYIFNYLRRIQYALTFQ